MCLTWCGGSPRGAQWLRLFFAFSNCAGVYVQVRKYVMEEVNKAGKAKKLRGFEMIKSVWLDEEPWSGGPVT